MNTTQIHRRRLLAGLAILGALPGAAALSGCATNPQTQTGADSASLLQRAGAFWTATQANDAPAAWPYEELSKKPGWTLQAYMQRGGIVYNEVQVTEVLSVDGGKALVEVKVVYSVPLVRMHNIEAVLRDEWVLLDGQWYHADRKGLL